MNKYLGLMCTFAVVAIACFSYGYILAGILAVAGTGAAGSGLINDSLPDQSHREDDDDLTGI